MNRARLTVVLALSMLVAAVPAARADVRADERARVEFAGMLGRMFNLFGGKSAREGVTSTVAVKGDRKATLNDTTGQIIDLGEQKIYDIDVKKKTYRVTTFAELRRQMEEAKKKAEDEARKEQAQAKPEAQAQAPAADEQQPQVDVDFDVKNTGQTKTINGFETHESVMTITVREKGKTLEESGGMVLTSDMWLGPKIPAMKDIADFDMRYAQMLFGPMVAGVSADQMATAQAMYPYMKPAMGKMAAEGAKLEGTAIQTVTTLAAVKSAEQMAAEAKAKEDDSKSKPSGTPSGMIGGFLAKKLQKKAAGGGGDDASSARATFMTTTTDVLKVVTDVTPADVAVPAGFKEGR